MNAIPVFSRKALRRTLGLSGLRDTFVGTTTHSLGANAAVVVMDRALANPFFSQADYEQAWLLVASFSYRAASYNYQSGSVVSGQLAVNALASGMDFEMSSILSPDDKDRCINDVVLRLSIRQEVGITGITGAMAYPLSAAASPHSIRTVLNAYYFADPTNSLNRDRRDFSSKVVVDTGSGPELRLDAPVPSGHQIVMDAILTLTLGAGDAATINIPDERLVLAGAEAKAYDLLMRQTPSQQSDLYKQARQDAAREFSRLSAIYKPQVSRTIQFDTPVDRRGIFWGN